VEEIGKLWGIELKSFLFEDKSRKVAKEGG